MGLIKKFNGKTVFIDTSPFIYFIEGHSEYGEELSQIFKANDLGNSK